MSPAIDPHSSDAAPSSTRRPSSQAPRDSLSLRDENQEMLARQLQLIPLECRHIYISPTHTANIVRDVIGSASFSPHQPYLYFQGAGLAEAEALDKALQHRQVRRAARLTFEGPSNQLIIRLTPGREHETAGVEFWYELRGKIAAIPMHTSRSVIGLGAERIIVPGERSKEGDQAIAPAARAAQSNPWPSVVVEVGYSETLNQLHIDAEWWLKNFEGRTRFVVLLSVNRDPNKIVIEGWRMLPLNRLNRHTPPLVPRCEQRFDIDAGGIVTSSLNQLTIPYASVFDEPHPNSTDVIFTTAELSSFALWLYSQWI